MLCKNQQIHKLTRNTCSVNQFKYSKVIEEYVFLFTYPSINLTLKIFCCVFFYVCQIYDGYKLWL